MKSNYKAHYFRTWRKSARAGHNSQGMQSLRISAVLLLVVFGTALLHAKQLAVVADTANATNNVTAAELINLFTTHTHAWADGKPAPAVVRAPSSSDMELVLREVFNMSVA